MSSKQLPAAPPAVTVLRVVHEGYWDRLDLIRFGDGTLRMRKASKGDTCAGPWGLGTLRREITYLNAVRGVVAGHFPELICYWDNSPDVGYDMSYIPSAVDAGKLASSCRLDQGQADVLQERLAEIVFDLVHEPVSPQQPLSVHVRGVMDNIFGQFARYSEFSELIDTPSVRVNNKPLAGARSAMKQFLEATGALARLDQPPQVRLHGDLFLQNVLVAESGAEDAWPSGLKLIDPVSVAGVFEGHPLFDLVKYESYATGELLALRAGRVEIDGFGDTSQRGYTYRVALEAAEISPFHQTNWLGRFRAAFTARYGAIHMPTYRLLEAYFAFVMAACTDGLQRRARVIKGVLALNDAISGND